MEQVDCIVAGAGVVGLAIGREAARRGWETLVLEATEAIGTQTSSRNSEVIHAGIYYPAGSLKARLCVDGRDRLYRFAEAHHVAHSRCGKLIVATTAGQEPLLSAIAASARSCGVDDLIPLDAAQARELEPALNCTAALLSPSTGIIDSHGLMLALRGDAEEHGALICFNTSIVSGRIEPDRMILQTFDRTDGREYEIAAKRFINAAGLGANAIASRLHGFDACLVPQLFHAKGNYFSVTGKAAFSRLIYPVPEPGGLGVHLTLDLNGAMRFGPDVEWTETVDYRIDPCRAAHFYAEIRKYWPQLVDDSLKPAYCGVRPKLSQQGAPNADFAIQGPEAHGVNGLVNLFGIESPGLTSCLSIAEHAVALAAT